MSISPADTQQAKSWEVFQEMLDDASKDALQPTPEEKGAGNDGQRHRSKFGMGTSALTSLGSSDDDEPREYNIVILCAY